jgi:hypothetical protein
MYIKNRLAAIIFRLVLLISSTVGLYINLGFNDGVFYPSALIWYTNLSNILCFLVFVPVFVRTVTGGQTFMPRMKGMATLLIAVTMIVYHTILARWQFPAYRSDMPDVWLSSLLMHYVTPTLVILDWLLFCPKRAFRLYDPLIWTALPFAYVVAMLIRAEIGGEIVGVGSRFPYFFLDVDVIGWAGLLGYVAAIAVGFILLGYAMVFVDKKMRD